MKITKTTDLELINRLDAEILYGDERLTQTELENTTWWVAWHRNKAVGFAGIKYGTEFNYTYGYLNRAGVIRSHRGKGTQLALIKVRERAAKAAGAKWLITYTVSYNYASANSLIKANFRLYQPEAQYGAKSALYFRKLIKVSK